MANIFEQAARLKLRFPFRGSTSTEDLWDLSLRDLDSIYQMLKRQEKDRVGESLLVEQTAGDTTLALQIAIVTRIVEVKLAEHEASKNAAANKARKQQLLGIIQSKRDAELHDLPVDKLQELVAELG